MCLSTYNTLKCNGKSGGCYGTIICKLKLSILNNFDRYKSLCNAVGN